MRIPKGEKRIPKKIIELLMSYPNFPFSRAYIWETIWGTNYIPNWDNNTLQANVSYARRLLNGQGEIRAVRGVGYEFVPC